ncbi:acyl-CoA dehydrogenase family protein [Halomarina litorea]|uniref:acyl-CoA dehydrogenase family protein n=1 Tax=Halomarina litorea TaxID=2961595 RepID=UPI0020C46CC0|nr:acyl-CoA dehydrogenase family protein [Halomarina sp. BCD28]
MEYDDSPQAEDLRARANSFMEEVVIPTEREHLGHGPIDPEVVEDLRDQAREYDVFCPQIGEEYGGMGMDFRDVLPLFEEAGRSVLGAPAMRVDAPDEGNMHTLEMFGTEEQKEEYLKPLVNAEIRSGFSMTEPKQGAGSDPKMMKTTAEKDGDEWVIDGHKWWTTNGGIADFFIVMALTDQDAHPYNGASLILVDRDVEGVDVVRDIPHMGQSLMDETHSEVRFDDVRVPEENLLGTLNEGFTHAQQRLGPARLTHCMRFTGMATRSLEIAKAYVSDREGFGSTLSEKQDLRFSIAEAETNLHATRTMVRHAAKQISEGNEARIPVSMCKVFAANATQETIDLAVQACGANGIGKDLPIADFYQAVRAFRIVDGADEVHKRVIARDAFEEVGDQSMENLTTF